MDIKDITSETGEKLRVASYCRVSTSTKDQENSFDNQKKFFDNEIKKHESWEYAGIYADRGVTGTKISRPEFDKLLRDCGLDENLKIEKPSKIDLILVKNTSRFGRNVGGVDTIIKALAANRCYIYFLDINKCTKNEEDIIYIQIFATFDENDSRDKSKKVRFGFAVAAEENRLRCSNRIFGFDYIKEERKLVKNKDSAVVKKIFDLYEAGNGVRKICNILEEEHYLSPTGNTHWGTTTIKNILDNEKYCGLNNPLKWTSGTVFVDKHSPKKNDFYKTKPSDNIEPIISMETFFHCRELRNGKVSIYNSEKKGVKLGVSKYGGHLTCGICGSHYISNKDGDRQFYNCSLKKKKGTKACNAVNITEEEIEELLKLEAAVWADIQTNYLDDYVKLCIEYIKKDTMEKYKADNSLKKKELENEIDVLQKKIDNIIDFIADIEGDTSTYKKKVNKMQQEISEKIQHLNDISNKDRYKKRIEFLENVQGSFFGIAELRNIWIDDILEMASKITVKIDEYGCKSLEFEYENLYLYRNFETHTGMFAEYPCCNVFTHAHSIQSVVDFFKKYPKIETLEDIERINNIEPRL